MHQYSGVLQVNLTAVRKNWQLLRAHYFGADCGAVVKTNAYGLGVAPIVQSLFSEGCRTFFVANYDEGVEIRRLLPNVVDVYVLQGCAPNMEQRFIESSLTPVVISVAMFNRWFRAVSGLGARGQKVRCALKVNTGMNRLGMSLGELKALSLQEENLKQAGVEMILSHLACADEPEHPLNQQQLQAFEVAVEPLKKTLPNIRASLANSAGIFLGESWQFDVARPGIALYGGAMTLSNAPNFLPVVSLFLPVLQVRELDAGESVGYGGLFRAERKMRIAIVSGGYGDGVLRSLSCSAFGWFHQKIPLLGRISMDSCVFDITDLTEPESPAEGDLIEVIGEHCLLGDVAKQAGTISYELLTRLGDRLEKHYSE